MLLDILNGIALLCNIALARLFFKYERFRSIRLPFTFFISGLSLWAFFIMCMYFFPAQADILIRISMTGIIFAVWFLYKFIDAVLVKAGKHKLFDWGLLIPAAFALAVDLSPLIVESAMVKGSVTTINSGPYVLLYSLYYVVLVAYLAYRMVSSYIKEQDALEKLRIKSLGITTLLTSLLTFFFSELLPIYLNSPFALKIAPLSSFVFVAGLAYGIIRYQFGHIRLIFNESLIPSVVTTILSIGLISLAYLSGLYLIKQEELAFFILILAVLTMNIFYEKIRTWIKSLITRGRLNYDEAINLINEAIVSIFDREELQHKIEILVERLFKPAKKDAVFFLEQEAGEKYSSLKKLGVHFIEASPDLFNEHKDHDLVLVFMLHNKLLGVIFLKLDPGQLNYTRENLDLLKIFTQEISVALLNLVNTEQRSRQQEQLFQAEKTALLGQLTAGIVHEIRNPVTSLNISLENIKNLLSKAGADPEQSERVLKTSQKSISEVKSFLTALLNFSRKEEFHKEVVVLDNIIEEAMLIVRKAAKNSGVKINKEVPKDLSLAADPQKLKQVVLNLMLNAIEAMPKEGVLKIRAEKQKTQVEIEISDNGPGIPEGKQQEIFVPFYTTKKEGTGLGLSIVKEIIDLHNGAINVSSAGGEGTSFKITLPDHS